MELRSKPYRPIPITFFRDINGGVQEPWKPYLYMTQGILNIQQGIFNIENSISYQLQNTIAMVVRE